jgi:hypothetical protein
MSTELRQLKLALANDKRYQRLKMAFSTLPIFMIDVDALMDEAMFLDTQREIKLLNNANPDFIDRMIRAGLKDQAHRSRLAQIYAESIRSRKTVEASLDAFTSYALIHYKDMLSVYRSLSERQGALATILSSEYKYLQSILTLQSMLTTIMEDIDKSYWALKTIVEAVKLVYVPERNLS